MLGSYMAMWDFFTLSWWCLWVIKSFNSLHGSYQSSGECAILCCPTWTPKLLVYHTTNNAHSTNINLPKNNNLPNTDNVPTTNNVYKTNNLPNTNNLPKPNNFPNTNNGIILVVWKTHIQSFHNEMWNRTHQFCKVPQSSQELR